VARMLENIEYIDDYDVSCLSNDTNKPVDVEELK